MTRIVKTVSRFTGSDELTNNILETIDKEILANPRRKCLNQEEPDCMLAAGSSTI